MQTNRSTLTSVLLIVFFTFTSFAQQRQRTAADYIEAGLAAQQANHFDEALAQYEAAIKLDAKDFGAQFNSGVCYMALHKWEAALKAFKIAVALKPNEAIVQFALANAEGATGNTLDSESSFLTAHHLQNLLTAALSASSTMQKISLDRAFIVALRFRAAS